MSYIPTRDRFDLPDDVTTRLFDLAERIEADAVLAYHRAECGCEEGTEDVQQCKYRAYGYGVSVLEALAALHVAGALDGETALGKLPLGDNYHATGVYCGEPAHCTEPYPGALPGTPYVSDGLR